MEIDLDCQYPYGELGNTYGLYTDHAIFWGEIKNHARINAEGSGSFDIAAGMMEHLPRKAKELGYMQAHVEAFMGMKLCGISLADCAAYLSLSSEQMGKLMDLTPVIKYRVFPAITTVSVREKAAESFIQGYDQAYEEISGRMDDSIDSEEVRNRGIETAMKDIRRLLPDDAYEEYCGLYEGVVYQAKGLRKPVEIDNINLTGCSKVPAEMFSGNKDPSVTITAGRLLFNKAAIRALGMVVFVDIRFDSATKRLTVYPSSIQDDRHVRWAVEKEGSICPKHMAWDTVPCFDAMGWNDKWRYKSIGTPEKDDGCERLIFQLEYSISYCPIHNP